MLLWRMSSADIVDDKIWLFVSEAILQVVLSVIDDDVVNLPTINSANDTGIKVVSGNYVV